MQSIDKQSLHEVYYLQLHNLLWNETPKNEIKLFMKDFSKMHIEYRYSTVMSVVFFKEKDKKNHEYNDYFFF